MGLTNNFLLTNVESFTISSKLQLKRVVKVTEILSQHAIDCVSQNDIYLV